MQTHWYKSFLAAYATAPIEIQKKARILFIVNNIIMVAFLVSGIGINTIVEPNLRTAVLEISMGLCLLGSLYILRTGHYKTASSSTIATLLAGMITAGFFGYSGQPIMDFMLLSLNLLPVIFYSCLIGCHRYQPIAAMALCLTANVAFFIIFFLCGSAGPITGTQYSLLINSSLLIAVSGVMAYYILSINREVITIAEDEAQSIREKTDQIIESEEKFRTLFENVTEGIALHEIVYDNTGRAINYRILDVNPAYEKNTGISPESARGKLATEVYGTESAPYLPLWAKVANTGTPHHSDLFFAPLNKHFRVAACSPKKGWFATVFEDITEKKLFEEKLMLSEEKFRSIVETTSDWIWESNEQAVCTYSGPQIETLLGYKPAEVIGRTPFDFMPKKEAERLKSALADVFINKRSYKNLEYKCLHKNGNIVILESSGIPLFNADGKFTGYRGVDRDITERKRAEEILQKNRDLLNKTGNIAKIGGWEFDVKTLTQTWTEEMFHIFEIDLSKSEPKVWEGVDFCAPSSKPIGDQAVRRAIEHGESYDIEVEIITAKGNHRWARSIGKPNYENGEIKNISGVFQDITERKQAEQVLNESRAQLQCILESTADGILTVDGKGRIIHANRHFAEMWQIPQQLVTGGNDNAVLDAAVNQLNDPDTFLKKVNQLYSSNASDMDILSFKDGRFFERYSSPLLLDSCVVGRVWSFRDITRQKKAETYIQQLNKELEQRVNNRTLQLELANRELQAFAYSVSHDLRAPLRSIDGFSTAILEDYSDKLDTEGRDYLQRLRRASQRMATLIDDLLKLSRVTSGEMNIASVNLSLLAVNIIADLHESDRDRNVETIIMPEVTVKADPQLMLSVMENLIGNAWKFTAKKKNPRIEFGVMKQDKETVYYVRDNGAGFDMAFVNKLFGAFQRLHSTGDYPGNGIGLANIQRVIHRHGGRVWAEGKTDEGAVFYFTLGSGIAETKET